nr:NADH dehydrogenase subunit 4 [Rhabdopleura sp. NHMO H2137]
MLVTFLVFSLLLNFFVPVFILWETICMCWGFLCLYFVLGWGFSNSCFYSSLSISNFSVLGVEVSYLSLGFLVLSCWFMIISLCSNYLSVKGKGSRQERWFCFFVQLVGWGLVFSFLCNSFILFIAFVESLVVPLMFLINGWGSEKDRYEASFYFLGYTVVFGYGFLILSCFLFFLVCVDSMDISWSSGVSHYFFGGVFVGLFYGFFLSKLAVYGFHLWLPKAHVEAPVGGSILLGGLILKLGGYGFIRLYPLILYKLSAGGSIVLCLFSLLGSLFSMVVAFSQVDLKKWVAYLSVGHMALAFSGLCVSGEVGLLSCMINMVLHCFSCGLLFFLVGLSYERLGSRSLFFYMSSSSSFKGWVFFWVFSCWVSCAMVPIPSFWAEFFESFVFFRLSFFFQVLGWLGPCLGLYCTFKVIHFFFSSGLVVSFRSLFPGGLFELVGLFGLVIPCLFLCFSLDIFFHI